MAQNAPAVVAKGQVAADPTVGMPNGSVLRFRPVPIWPAFQERTASLNNWDFFEGILLMVSFTDHAMHFIDGSAVLVAPGIALCATHVVEPRLPQLMAAEAHAMCKSITSSGLLLWNIRKVTLVPNSDFTILGLELASALPPNNEFRQAAITTRTPKAGEELLICGFRAQQAAFPISDRENIELGGEVRLSKGTVSNLFVTGRDRCMLPWPTIEVACPAMGGMSGGPVFDSRGHLIGLLTSSLETDNSDGVSYVSHIWPALTAQTEPVWPQGFFKCPACLLEMDPRICAIDKRDALKRTPYNNDSGYLTEYRPWVE